MTKLFGEHCKLIGFTGQMEAGKTTAAKVTGFELLNFADPLKKCIGELFLFSEDQLHTMKGKNTVDDTWGATPREIMQQFGTEFIRANFPGFWVKRMDTVLSSQALYKNNVAIGDIRFEDEAQMVRDLGGTVVHIVRHTEGNEFSGHASEQKLKVKYGDHVLENTGSLSDFKSTVFDLVNNHL